MARIINRINASNISPYGFISLMILLSFIFSPYYYGV